MENASLLHAVMRWSDSATRFRRALEQIVREDHEGGPGWMAEIAQKALDEAAW